MILLDRLFACDPVIFSTRPSKFQNVERWNPEFSSLYTMYSDKRKGKVQSVSFYVHTTPRFSGLNCNHQGKAPSRQRTLLDSFVTRIPSKAARPESVAGNMLPPATTDLQPGGSSNRLGDSLEVETNDLDKSSSPHSVTLPTQFNT